MELLALLFPLLFLLTLVWILLLFKGLDPLRLLRSQFKSPKLPLTLSKGERERLLASFAPDAALWTGRARLYSETMIELSGCETVGEMESLLQLLHDHDLVSSEITARHFATHCENELALATMPASALAIIITCLHKYAWMQTAASCIRQCFVSALGPKALALKIDLEQRLSIFELLYQHVRDKAVRETILQHLEREAIAAAAMPGFVAPIKLLCDIDDTLLSALFDYRYPELTVYPGVHQFVAEVLAREQRALSELKGELLKVRPRLAFLTARPEFLRQRSNNELRECGFSHFTLLMGSLRTFCAGPRRVASRKLKSFERFHRIFAECKFVFVGDNGQGDIDLGKELLQRPEKYGVVSVLIHDVVRNQPTESESSEVLAATLPPYRYGECVAHGIHSFRTYISAIGHLYTREMVDADAVMHVIEKTTAAYAAIRFHSKEQQQNLAREIAADIGLVLQQLPFLAVNSLLATMHQDILVHVQRHRIRAKSPNKTTSVEIEIDHVV